MLEKLNIHKQSYIDELINNALNSIYNDPTIEFDDEVKKQIEDIMDLANPDQGFSLRSAPGGSQAE